MDTFRLEIPTHWHINTVQFWCFIALDVILVWLCCFQSINGVLYIQLLWQVCLVLGYTTVSQCRIHMVSNLKKRWYKNIFRYTSCIHRYRSFKGETKWDRCYSMIYEWIRSEFTKYIRVVKLCPAKFRCVLRRCKNWQVHDIAVLLCPTPVGSRSAKWSRTPLLGATLIQHTWSS